MLWLKSLHIVFMVTWFAGLFYLPRLYVYHAMATDQAGKDRFKIMERKLYFGIMTPGAVLTLVLGIWMLIINGWATYSGTLWLHIKLACVVLLVFYHIYCGKLLFAFKHDRNTHSHIWYRWFNEIPVAFLFIIVILAVVRPF